MTESNVVGWVFEGANGVRWAVQAETKEEALKIFTSTAPSTAEIADERTIQRDDAEQYQLEAGKAVRQEHGGDGRRWRPFVRLTLTASRLTGLRSEGRSPA